MKVFYKILKVALCALSVAAIFYMAAIILWGSAYTVLSADDFSHGVDLGVYGVSFPRYLFESIFFMGFIYFIWQGTFFSMFLQALLSPINGYGLPQLRIVMIINALLILGTLLFFIYELFQRIPKENRYFMPVVSALTLFTLYGFVTYYEVFFWYSGCTSYGFPFSAMMAGLAFTLRYYRTEKRSDMIFAKVFGFLAGGGTLMIGGAGCYTALLILIYYSVKNHYVDYDGRRIFKWWFIGALVNTVAPGNYARKLQSTGASVGIIASLKNSVLICLRNCKYLLRINFLLQILLFCFIIGIILGLLADKKPTKRDMKLLCIIAVISPVSSWVACFPASLGYGASSDLANRCNFIMSGVFILSTIFASIVLGYAMTMSLGKKSAILVPVIFAAIVLFSVLLPVDLTANKYVEIQNQLTSGEIQQYYTDCKDYLDKIDDYPEGSDVRVPLDEIPRAITNTHNFYDFEDPTNPGFWMNESLAKYYGFSSFAAE